ncbi:MAG: two pore domain potassium channel family protein [Gammaproteobacteria bacterium]|nr:two pore domain potassium channel family protein [Gammaproteobacteria bacterium]
MYESKSKPLTSRKTFGKRMLLHVLTAFLLVVITLVIGITGHVYFDNMKPGTALIASITLTSGLGLSVLPETTSGQLFASLYMIFSGYVYIVTSSIILAPILHRILHKFHLDE